MSASKSIEQNNLPTIKSDNTLLVNDNYQDSSFSAIGGVRKNIASSRRSSVKMFAASNDGLSESQAKDNLGKS